MSKLQIVSGFAAGVIFTLVILFGGGRYIRHLKLSKTPVTLDGVNGKLELPPEAKHALDILPSVEPPDLLHNPHPTPQPQVQWVEMHYGDQLPKNALYAGDQLLVGGYGGAAEGGSRPIYVCRAPHANGVHPGKWDLGTCFIGYAGKEVAKRDYQIAVYDGRGTWGRKSSGSVLAGTYDPNFELQGALVGGFENGGYLYVCRFRFHDTFFLDFESVDFGWHAGKRLTNGHCHIGVNGDEKDDLDFEYFYPNL